MRFAVVVEMGERNLSAFVPDLPGCAATGGTLAELKRNLADAITLHLHGMQEDGEPIPEPTVYDFIDVDPPAPRQSAPPAKHGKAARAPNEPVR